MRSLNIQGFTECRPKIRLGFYSIGVEGFGYVAVSKDY